MGLPCVICEKLVERQGTRGPIPTVHPGACLQEKQRRAQADLRRERASSSGLATITELPQPTDDDEAQFQQRRRDRLNRFRLAFNEQHPSCPDFELLGRRAWELLFDVDLDVAVPREGRTI